MAKYSLVMTLTPCSHLPLVSPKATVAYGWIVGLLYSGFARFSLLLLHAACSSSLGIKCCITFALSSTVSRFRRYCWFYTPWANCEVSAPAHEYVGLIDIMHPATLHGIGVITKLYFAIFAIFKESVTLNLAQRSFSVIDFGTSRKRIGLNVFGFLLVVSSNLYPILHRLRDTAA